MLKLELSVIYSLVPVYQFYLPFSPKATYLCRYLPGTTYIPVPYLPVPTFYGPVRSRVTVSLGSGAADFLFTRKHELAKNENKNYIFSYKNRPENDGSPAPQKNMVR